MKSIIVIALLYSFSFCNVTKQHATGKNEGLQTDTFAGFIFIDVAKVYYQGGDVVIYSQEGNADTLFHLQNKMVKFRGDFYDFIEDDYKYKNDIHVESFFPENGLFILKCLKESDTRYLIEFNGRIGSVGKSDLIEFKTLERYVLDTSPIPTESNPVRMAPAESATFLEEQSSLTFVAVEIKGDWLKVRDDKDCYPGEFPSEKDFTGWIRWRKNGDFILKVAHTC